MNHVQLCFAVGVPVFTVSMGFLGIVLQVKTINARIASLEVTVNSRFTSLESRFDTRLTRVEERLERR